MTETGTCPFCGNRTKLNVMTGKVIRHVRLAEDGYETCPGSNQPPTESRASNR